MPYLKPILLLLLLTLNLIANISPIGYDKNRVILSIDAQVITESKGNGTKIEYTYGNDLINNGSNFFLTDALGSTRALIDSSENLTDSYTYTAYGKLLNHNGTSESS